MQPVYWLATKCIAGAEAGNQRKASALFRWKKEKMGRMWYILACHWEKQEGDKVLGLATVTFRLRMDIHNSDMLHSTLYMLYRSDWSQQP